MTVNVFNMTDTWNDGGTVFTGIKMNIANTASAAGSKVIDLQIGGNSIFHIDKAGVAELLNGTSATGLSIYNTYTDASNYERGVIDWTTTANVLTIGTQAAGTGTLRRVNIVSGGLGTYISDDGTDIAVFQNGVAYLARSVIGMIGDSGLDRVTTNVIEFNNAGAGGVGYMRLNGVAVGSLPAASTTYKGCRGTVTDSNATLTAGIGAVVASGGSNIVPVFCDGTNWRIG